MNLNFIGIKVRDTLVSETAKYLINCTPCMTEQEKYFARIMINGISIVKTVYDVADLIRDNRNCKTYRIVY